MHPLLSVAPDFDTPTAMVFGTQHALDRVAEAGDLFAGVLTAEPKAVGEGSPPGCHRLVRWGTRLHAKPDHSGSA